MKVLDFHGIQTSKVNKHFLVRDMPTHAQDMLTHQDVHTSGYSCGVQ